MVVLGKKKSCANEKENEQPDIVCVWQSEPEVVYLKTVQRGRAKASTGGRGKCALKMARLSAVSKLPSFTRQTLLTAYFRSATAPTPAPSPAPAAPVAPIAVVPSPELNHFRDSVRFSAPMLSVLSNNKNMNNSSGPSTSSSIPSSSSMMPSPFHDPFDIMNPFYGPLTYSPASPDYVDPYAFLNNQPSTSSQY